MKPKKESLNLTTKTIIQCFRTSHQSINSSWHFYDEYELRVFGDISGEAHIGSFSGTIEPFSIYLIAPNLPHSWENTSCDAGSANTDLDKLSFSIFFPEEAIARAQRLFPELNCLRDMLEQSKSGLTFPASENISDIGHAIAELDSLKGCEKLCSFFMILDRLRDTPYQTLSSNAPTGMDKRHRCEALDWALDYINHNFDKAIDLETVASVACMSPSYFCRLFKATFNTGLIEYINTLRVEKMCFFLERTTKSISTIALETGFTNLSNCNRTFKKQMNMSPSQYREHYWSSRSSEPDTHSNQQTIKQMTN